MIPFYISACRCRASNQFSFALYHPDPVKPLHVSVAFAAFALIFDCRWWAMRISWAWTIAADWAQTKQLRYRASTMPRGWTWGRWIRASKRKQSHLPQWATRAAASASPPYQSSNRRFEIETHIYPIGAGLQSVCLLSNCLADKWWLITLQTKFQ